MGILFSKHTRMVILLDILILIELTGCMYWANRFPENLTVMFLSTYLPIAFVTMVVGKIWLKRYIPAGEMTKEMKGQSTCPSLGW
jgi:hypothetical protein